MKKESFLDRNIGYIFITLFVLVSLTMIYYLNESDYCQQNKELCVCEEWETTYDGYNKRGVGVQKEHLDRYTEDKDDTCIWYEDEKMYRCKECLSYRKMTYSQINHTKVWGFSTSREGED